MLSLTLFIQDKTESRLRKVDAAKKGYKMEPCVSKALADPRKNLCFLVKSNQLCGYVQAVVFNRK